MARKKKADGGGGGSGDWLNTYADMVTLLLTFFVLLFSMSSLDAAKFNMLVNAFLSEGESSDKIIIVARPSEEDGQLDSDTSGEKAMEDVSSLEDVFNKLLEYLEENDMQDSVEVSHDDGYVFIRFMDEMLFQPNSARLKNPNMEILNFVGLAIKSIQNDVEMISINGHTAEIIDNPDYAVSDRELSSARANVVLMYLEDTTGVDSTKLVQVAWGKYRPFESNETAEGMAKNRRVEILISSDNPIADQLENVYEKLVEQ
ncbi:MAG: OmpA family protein [Oscillospiraceae bacterium]|jgi:chemotaxis protein MotB|nr:OmpA family protein [Oscillospiraceae bacterium]